MTNNLIAFGLYLGILALLTYIASKDNNKDDFLVASRRIGWKSLSVSIFASIISSYNIVVSLSLSFIFGPWVALVYMGALMAFVVIYYLVKNESVKKIVNGNYNTIVDFLIDKFGRANASVLNLSFIIVLFLFISVQFYVNTSIFSSIMGWNKYVSTLLVGAIVFLYVARGGLKVEILTDVFQGLLMLLFVGLLFFIDISKLNAETIMPILTNKTLMVSAICLCVSQFLTLLVQPDLWQRMFACRSHYDLKKGILMSAVLVSVFIIPIIIIGLSVKAIGIENSENLFYDILRNAAPSWFLPFISVALFAAFMSSLDSALFAISSQIGQYGFWIKEKQDLSRFSKEKTIKNIQTSLLFVTSITLITSLFFTNFLTSVMQLMSLLTVNSVVILCGLVLNLSKNEMFISSLLGIILFFIAAFGHIITDEPYTVLYPSFAILLFILLQRFVILFIQKYRNYCQNGTK